MLPAGKLNRKLVIQQRDSGVDAAGQPIETFSTFATVYAWIRQPTGSASAERITGGQEVSSGVFSARIRYRTDITAGMRAVENLVVYDIKQVMPDVAGRHYTDLVLETGASED
jgi:SPP1 family predicted phage head-tail adaptor